jgi:hypothetical protein
MWMEVDFKRGKKILFLSTYSAVVPLSQPQLQESNACPLSLLKLGPGN